MTIEALAELQRQMVAWKTECLSLLHAKESAGRARRSECLAHMKGALREMSEEDWATVLKTDSLGELAYYAFERRECWDGARSLADYKISKERWTAFASAMTDSQFSALWEVFARDAFRWEGLSDLWDGYYLQAEYAGFSTLFSRICNIVLACGRTRGLSRVEILGGVTYILANEVFLPDTDILTDMCVEACRGTIPETWVAHELVKRVCHYKENGLLNPDCSDEPYPHWQKGVVRDALQVFPEMFEELTAEEKAESDRKRKEFGERYGILPDVCQADDSGFEDLLD